MTHIADLALLSDLQTAALVDRTGSVVWCCFPSFDSAACFASLVGDEDNGHWRLAPTDPDATVERRYRTGLVLESVWTTSTGRVAVIDFMRPRNEAPDIVRIAVGLDGEVELGTELVVRFDYGSVVPWVRRVDGDLLAIAGPDKVRLRTPIDTEGADLRTRARFTVSEGDRIPFVLDWQASHEPVREHADAEEELTETERFWDSWIDQCSYDGHAAAEVRRSLAVLKGLTYLPTGGMVAAPTTSLPEELGGERNWDYRFCWLRDATYTLLAFLQCGYTEEAAAWRDWLLRAAAGQTEHLQIMYGIHGERRLPEWEVPWLDGYRGSRPVRVGNGAHQQFQLDVLGEVMDAMHQARTAGLEPEEEAWQLQRVLMGVVEDRWREPDNGIWEIRGDRQHFTHSKLMAWVAFDRAVAAVENFDLDGPVDRWKQLRDEVADEILQHGVDERGVFVQSYGSSHLDASLLLVPIVGFLPPDDERVIATTRAIIDELTVDGLVARYDTDSDVDGLPGSEGAFLLCSFWLVDVLAMQGRTDDARRAFRQLCSYRNDVGLLAEEIDPATGHFLGNMPQAFSHLGLISSARNLDAAAAGASEARSRSREER